VPPVITLLVLALVLASAPVTFALINHWQAGRWDNLMSTDCLAANPAADQACVGVVRIPSLGDDWARPLLAESQAGWFDSGVVWVEGTTEPGQIGNCVISGRRVGGGKPMAGVENLNAGDVIVIETASHRYTYVVDLAPRDLTVPSSDSWVLDPVPGSNELEPQQALLTLVLRQDRWPTRERSIGIAILQTTETK
jgi:sortase A